MRKDFYLVTDHPLYELIVKKPTANKCMEMMSAIAAKDKGALADQMGCCCCCCCCCFLTRSPRAVSQVRCAHPRVAVRWLSLSPASPDPTIKIDLNFELGETMNRTGTQWGGCYIKLTPSKHSMSRKSRLRERVIPYPAYPGDPAVYTGPFTTSPGPAHIGVGMTGAAAPPSPPGLPLPPFATGGGLPAGEPRGMTLRGAGKRNGGGEEEQDEQPMGQELQRVDANGQDENGSFQSAMSWLYGTWGIMCLLSFSPPLLLHPLCHRQVC
jgi:hypothetical protein